AAAPRRTRPACPTWRESLMLLDWEGEAPGEVDLPDGPGGNPSSRIPPTTVPRKSCQNTGVQSPGMEHESRPTHVVVLGSTGSIGRSALSVIEHDGGTRLRAWGLSGHTRCKELASQAVAHRPRFVAVTEPDTARRMEQELRGTGIEVLCGLD